MVHSKNLIYCLSDLLIFYSVNVKGQFYDNKKKGGGADSDGRCVRTDTHPSKGIEFLSSDMLLEFTNLRHGLKGYLNKILVFCVSSV